MHWLARMKKLRSIIFWCHLPAGVIAGSIVLIMSVTGTLLAFERQITLWADTRSCHVAPLSTQTSHLPVETLMSAFREKQLGAPTTLTLRADPGTPAAIGLSGGRTVFVDPYTGEVLGEGSQRVRGFFRVITDWHRWLGMQGENRTIAKAITGACNLVFLFLVCSGFYLWWPRKWNWSLVRNVLWFRRGLPGKARDFNWHNVIGSWSVAPLFLIVLSGVVISYPWASNLVYRLVGEAPPAPRGAPGSAPGSVGPPPRDGAGGPARQARERGSGDAAPQAKEQSPEANSQIEPSLDGIDKLWARAEQQIDGWRSITLRLPNSTDAPISFTIDSGNGGQPQKRAQLTLDRRTGEVVLWEPFSNQTTGRQLRSFLRFAHTGEVGGFIGQTIAGIASAGSAVLVWTGLALAFRRFLAWRTRRLTNLRETSQPFGPPREDVLGGPGEEVTATD
jgi:uncharacterized iron-regulated membrane protein